MSTSPAKLLVLVGRDFACLKISGRANFSSGPDFKALLTGLAQKGYHHFIIDLSECVLMDSTFLGVLAGFGMKMDRTGGADQRSIELYNPNARITELLENLGALNLFKVITGPLPRPDGVQTSEPEPGNPSREEISRTCLEAHQTLMTVHPDNVARFKEVARFLAEDLNSLEKAK